MPGPQSKVVVEEEEEAASTHESITNEDPPNAQQAQHRPKPRGAGCGLDLLKSEGTAQHDNLNIDQEEEE